MTEEYDDIILVISKWKDFRNVQKDGDLKTFANWILRQNKSPSKPTDQKDFIFSKVEKMEEKNMIPNLANRGIISHLLARVDLYVKSYIKKPFLQIGFKSLDEFRLLQMIDRTKKINKSELSTESLMEFSTVVDVLKRFSKRGLIKQVKDPDDQRSSLLQTTAKGKILLITTYKTLAGIEPNVAGDLNSDEQETLIKLLTKLNSFHTNYFEEHLINKRKKS